MSNIFTMKEIEDMLRPYFAELDYIDKAYLFGSYARGEATPRSDVDIMIVPNCPDDIGIKVCLLYEGIGELLQKQVDIITEEEALTIMPKTMERDKVLIYERRN